MCQAHKWSLVMVALLGAGTWLAGCARSSGVSPAFARELEVENDMEHVQLIALRDLIEWAQVKRALSLRVFIADTPSAYRATGPKHSSKWLREAIALPPIDGVCQAIPCQGGPAEYQSLLFVGVDSVVGRTQVFVTIAEQVAHAEQGTMSVHAYKEREIMLRKTGDDWEVAWRNEPVYDDF